MWYNTSVMSPHFLQISNSFFIYRWIYTLLIKAIWSWKSWVFWLVQVIRVEEGMWICVFSGQLLQSNRWRLHSGWEWMISPEMSPPHAQGFQRTTTLFTVHLWCLYFRFRLEKMTWMEGAYIKPKYDLILNEKIYGVMNPAHLWV